LTRDECLFWHLALASATTLLLEPVDTQEAGPSCQFPGHKITMTAILREWIHVLHALRCGASDMRRS
jgi:hypothetical protein